jgi:hypothetical protein
VAERLEKEEARLMTEAKELRKLAKAYELKAKEESKMEIKTEVDTELYES